MQYSLVTRENQLDMQDVMGRKEWKGRGKEWKKMRKTKQEIECRKGKLKKVTLIVTQTDKKADKHRQI